MTLTNWCGPLHMSKRAVIARNEATHPRVASLALRAIHLLAISWYAVRLCTIAQEIATALWASQ